MRTNVRESSLDAYYGYLVPRGLQAQQQVILRAMARLGSDWLSRRQVAKAANLETSTVAGRINAMIAAGLVEEDHEVTPCSITLRGVHKVRLSEKLKGD